MIRHATAMKVRQNLGEILSEVQYRKGKVLTTSPEYKLAPARRKAVTLRFARTAGQRLMRLERLAFS